MKYQKLLLITALSLLTTACSDSDGEKKSNSKGLKESFLSERVYTYLFSDTQHEDVHTVTDSAKHFLKKIWLDLKLKGFTGYNDTILDHKILHDPDDISLKSAAWRSVVHRTDHDFRSFFQLSFHDKFIMMLRNNTANIEKLEPIVTCGSLLGLQWNGQYLYGVKHLPATSAEIKTNSDIYTYYLSAIEPDWAHPKPSPTAVTEAQLEEWNKVFLKALKEDDFFKQFFEPQSLSDGSGMTSFLNARRGQRGIDMIWLTVNGVSGSRVDLGLPVFVQLKGSVDRGKSTNLTTSTLAYKLGNTLVGAIQTYSNSGTGFGHDGRQLETSIVASQNFNNFFMEFQLGSISAHDVHFNDWSGSRAQFTVGIDTPWVSPFVQVSYRNLNDQPDTTVYGGLEIDLSELKTDGYTVSTHLLTKAGYSNLKGTTGAVEWSNTLTLNSGLSFSTNLTLGTVAEPSAGLTFKLDH
jgi:hypothetical protein